MIGEHDLVGGLDLVGLFGELDLVGEQDFVVLVWLESRICLFWFGWIAGVG